LKNFYPQNREPLIALLKRNHKSLANHPNWIIDVRGNDGGDDSSYAPLLSWLLPDEMVSVGDMWLATPANVEGHKNACALFDPGNAMCEKEINEAIARIRNAPTGSLVPQDDKGSISFERQRPLELRRPSRVAILIDGGCVSSCEQFLLTTHQSFNVKLIGRRSYGALDFSNCRPFALPAGLRLLMYATSRSLRIPDQPVDLAGIPPDIYLPLAHGDHAKEEEVDRVQSWLEGGSLAPHKTEANSKPLANN
jgi:C-terminal processing protease CtpA/Prc